MENAIYSILSPEGFAAILWKDSTRAKEAAEVMKLTAEDLKELGMIEQVIPEPDGYTVENMQPVAAHLEEKLEAFLKKWEQCRGEEIVEQRYQRFRNM